MTVDSTQPPKPMQKMPDVIVHTWNPRAGEIEAGGDLVPSGQPRLIVSSRPDERPCPKEGGQCSWGCHLILSTNLHMYTHKGTCQHIRAHAHINGQFNKACPQLSYSLLVLISRHSGTTSYCCWLPQLRLSELTLGGCASEILAPPAPTLLQKVGCPQQLLTELTWF